MALSKDEILEAIKELPVIELAGLVKDLEEEFGVSAAAAAPVAIAAATCPKNIASGKFHGLIHNTTPRASSRSSSLNSIARAA